MTGMKFIEYETIMRTDKREWKVQQQRVEIKVLQYSTVDAMGIQ